MPRKYKYKVRIEYRGTVTVDVEAGGEKSAEQAALEEGEQIILGNLHVYDTTIQRVE